MLAIYELTAIGIDLKTTNTVFCLRQLTIIKNVHEAHMTSSVVGFSSAGVKVGSAVKTSISNRQNIVYES